MGELCLAASPTGDAIRAAVAALLPAGPWTQQLAPAITEAVLMAVFYAHARRRARTIRIQCFLRQTGATPPACGLSFFLVESGAAPAGSHPPAEAVVQIYLFHE